jgi:putative membrane protein
MRSSQGSEEGSEPDPRFTLANERTLLAWNRTALAVIAGGLAVAQFLRVGRAGARLAVALGMALILVGAFLSAASYRNWQRVELALRLGQPLPTSALPRILVYAVAFVAAGAIALAALLLTS